MAGIEGEKGGKKGGNRREFEGGFQGVGRVRFRSLCSLQTNVLMLGAVPVPGTLATGGGCPLPHRIKTQTPSRRGSRGDQKSVIDEMKMSRF